MSLRKPLVLVAGEIAQLPSGDDIDAPFSGAIETTLTNGNASPAVICAPVYASAAATFDKANATTAATAKVIGLVSTSPSITNGTTGQVAIAGLLTATTAQWDAVVTGASGGLVFNTNYYLDTTAGKLVPTTPTTTSGQNNVFIGRGLSATVMELGIRQPILL